MTIKDAILELAKSNINENNNWYNWRKINEEKLPNEISLPDGNQYIKNIALKNELHKSWTSASTQDKKYELIHYYIAAWGGIHSNSEETLNEYSILPAESLISKGKEGIASWSKAICIHNPNEYAIFDARVSVSLNSLQIIYDTEDKLVYPILTSQNKTITKCNKYIKDIAKSENWTKLNEDTFYKNYLTLLKEIASKTNTSIATIEMLLFAKAEELVGIAYPKHAINSDPEQEKDTKDNATIELDNLSNGNRNRSLYSITFNGVLETEKIKKSDIGFCTIKLLEKHNLINETTFKYLMENKSCSHNLLKTRDEILDYEIKYNRYRTNNEPEINFNGKDYFIARNWDKKNTQVFIDEMKKKFVDLDYEIHE